MPKKITDYEMQAEMYHHRKHRMVCAALQQMYSLYVLIEDACLQVNWGAKLLFAASFIFFAKAASKWLANDAFTRKVISHCSTSLPVYVGLVDTCTCLLLDH